MSYLTAGDDGSVESAVPAGGTAPSGTRTYNPYGAVRNKTGASFDTGRGFLGQIEDPRAAPALVRALSDTAAKVRENVLQALGDLHNLEKAPSALVDALKDPSPELRAKAARALGEIHDPTTATAYSVAQQLVTTAWSQVLAIVLVVWTFGWSGGRAGNSG